MPKFDICAGGTVPAGTTSFILNNHHNEACDVEWTGTVPPGQPDSFTVPAKTEYNVDCDGWPADTYPYSASCCDDETNPAIVMQ